MAVCLILALLACSEAAPRNENEPPPEGGEQPQAQEPGAGNKEASNYLREQQVNACRCDDCRCSHCKAEPGAKCYCLDRTQWGKLVCACGATADACKCDHCCGQPNGGRCPCREK